MRPRAAILVLLASSTALAAAPPVSTEAARYLELHAKRDELLRLNGLLKQEATLASARNPYVVLDIGRRTMDFRVRGRTFKSYAFDSIRLESRPDGLSWPEVAARLAEPITVEQKEGGHPELVPPDPDEDPNSVPESEPEEEEEPANDATVLGVEAPTNYIVNFEQGVIFHVSAPASSGLLDKAMDGLGGLASGLRSVFTGWLGAPESEEGPWLDLYLTASPETARLLHHSLVPGERFLIVLPAPAGTSDVQRVE